MLWFHVFDDVFLEAREVFHSRYREVLIVRVDAAQDVVFQTVLMWLCEDEREREREYHHWSDTERLKRFNERTIMRYLHRSTTFHRNFRRKEEEETMRRWWDRFKGEKTKQQQRAKDVNAEEEITKTPNQYAYVEVNSSASLRTGRSSTLKSKFKDVISLKRCDVWVLIRFDEEKKSLSTRKEKGKRKMWTPRTRTQTHPSDDDERERRELLRKNQSSFIYKHFRE